MRLIEYISSCIAQDEMTPALQDDMTPIKQELIRCRDCRWWDYGQNEYGEWIGCKAKQLQFPFGDDFCSRAERKEE